MPIRQLLPGGQNLADVDVLGSAIGGRDENDPRRHRYADSHRDGRRNPEGWGTISRVLITGGNGFVGSHLAERLLDLGEEVTLFDRTFGSNTRGVDCPKIEGDIKDPVAVREAVGKSDAVFHLAAVSRVAWGEQDPLLCWGTNASGTVNVLEACRKAEEKRPVLFYASSREVYGEPQYLPVRESHPKTPKSFYGVSKLGAEQACLAYSRGVGGGPPVRHVVLRFSNVYGSERDLPERVVPKFMAKALGGEDIVLFGGDQVLDFTFVDDTVDGIMMAYKAASEGAILGEDFHFATGRGCSVYELARMIVRLTGSSSRIIKGPAQGFDVQTFYADTGKAKEMLGYEAKTPLEEGLEVLRERMRPVEAPELR